MLGSWNVNVVVNAMPQKVATAFGKLAETMMGAEYEPIAYLGSQEVNGTNVAVLAKQVIVTGRDTENIVVIVFNWKINELEATLVSIDRVLEGGAQFGGVNIDVKTDIPENTMALWNEAFEGFVGSKVVPFAYLGKQVVNGTNFIFAAEVTPATLEKNSKVAIVTINSETKQVNFGDILASKHEASLGYAFSW